MSKMNTVNGHLRTRDENLNPDNSSLNSRPHTRLTAYDPLPKAPGTYGTETYGDSDVSVSSEISDIILGTDSTESIDSSEEVAKAKYFAHPHHHFRLDGKGTSNGSS